MKHNSNFVRVCNIPQLSKIGQKRLLQVRHAQNSIQCILGDYCFSTYVKIKFKDLYNLLSVVHDADFFIHQKITLSEEEILTSLNAYNLMSALKYLQTDLAATYIYYCCDKTVRMDIVVVNLLYPAMYFLQSYPRYNLVKDIRYKHLINTVDNSLFEGD